MASTELSDSILVTVKKLLGIEREYTQFDMDVIVNINSAIMTLRQLGVGPQDGFSITGEDEKWEDLIGDSKLLDQVETYLYLKTKIVFDPPTSSFVLEAYKEQIKELEWRLEEQNNPENVFD